MSYEKEKFNEIWDSYEISKNVTALKTEVEKFYGAYKDKFKSEFPTIPLATTRNDEEIIKIINTCISENKDVYEMGYLTIDSDILY